MSNKFIASNRTSAERNSISLCKICGEKVTSWDSDKDSRLKNLDLSIHVCKKVVTCRNKKGYLIDSKGNLIHQIIYEQHFGKVKKGNDIHHINLCKTDNSIGNLISIPRIIHYRIHDIIKHTNRVMNKEEIEKFTREYFKIK